MNITTRNRDFGPREYILVIILRVLVSCWGDDDVDELNFPPHLSRKSTGFVEQWELYSLQVNIIFSFEILDYSNFFASTGAFQWNLNSLLALLVRYKFVCYDAPLLVYVTTFSCIFFRSISWCCGGCHMS